MPFLAETLMSVRRQTRPADEIVVVDNCSTDDTREFLNSQPDILVFNQTQGVSAPAN